MIPASPIAPFFKFVSYTRHWTVAMMYEFVVRIIALLTVAHTRQRAATLRGLECDAFLLFLIRYVCSRKRGSARTQIRTMYEYNMPPR